MSLSLFGASPLPPAIPPPQVTRSTAYSGGGQVPPVTLLSEQRKDEIDLTFGLYENY